MTQTGTYNPIDEDQIQLEIQKESTNMVRPAMDFSQFSVPKTAEIPDWAQETFQREQEQEQLPMAVLRPKTSQPTQNQLVNMRGVTSGIGMDLNSEPEVERFMAIPDDATIKTSQASTARLRRQSDYVPTEDEFTSSTSTITENNRPRKIDMSRPTSERYQPSTSSEDTYRPINRPDHLDHGQDNLDEFLEETSINLTRTSGTFNGVYFPCFGIFSAPLFGTEIFPLPPKQEKYHFNLVMNEPTDHYDGNPNSKYEDEIRRFMKDQIFAFEQTSTSFNAQRLLDEQMDLWWRKFPLASIRWGQTVAAYEELPPIREKFYSVEANPNLLTNRMDHYRVPLGNVKTKQTVSGAHSQPKPVTSKDRLLEKRQQLESDKFKVFLGETDFRQTTTMVAYDEFTKVVHHFRINGGSFKEPSNHIRKMANLLKDVNSITDMQKWLVFNQGKEDFNAYHDGWTQTPLMRKRISITDRARRTEDMLACLEYHNFLQIRSKVSWKKFQKSKLV